MADMSISNSLNSFIYFLVVTIIYFLLKVFTKSEKMLMIFMVIYFFMILVTQFFINLSSTNKLCGVNQYGTASIVTFIPWIIMLGSIKMLLTIFPGWLSPFSNTFGYIVTKLLGIGGLLNKILSGKFEKEGVSETTKIAAEALEHIYGDKSLLINEITQENFNTFWDRMSDAKIFKPDSGQYKEQLLGLVKIKDIVSEFIWYVLTGGLVSSVSYNYIVNTECTKSTSEIEQRANRMMSNMNDKTKPRIYTSSE
jgi:hypothetical protein